MKVTSSFISQICREKVHLIMIYQIVIVRIYNMEKNSDVTRSMSARSKTIEKNTLPQNQPTKEMLSPNAELQNKPCPQQERQRVSHLGV